MSTEADSVNLTFVAQRAYEIARTHTHEMVTLEHVLSALLEQAEVQVCYTALGLDYKALADLTDSFLEADFIPRNATLPLRSHNFENLFALVFGASRFSKRRVPTALDIMLQLSQFPAEDSHAVTSLLRSGINALAMKRYISHGAPSGHGHADKVPAAPAGDTPDAEPQNRDDAMRLLRKYCTDLNREAKGSRIDPVIGRTDEIDQIVQIIARRTKNNVVLVGDPGVGKTAIAEGLAYLIEQGRVPQVIAESIVWSLDIGSLVAGTRYRGDFEERMKLVLKALALVENSILFIDEIHTIMDAGSGNKGSLDVANLLKPALAKGTLRCIGSTTGEEYRKHFEKDRALVRRFKKVMVEEPTPEVAKLILHGLAPVYAAFHHVTYTHAAIDAAVDLTHKYVCTALLPDKAIDILDNAGARQRVTIPVDRVSEIGVHQIEEEVQRVAHIPAQEIEEDEATKLMRLEHDLRATVFGQDRALSELSDAAFVSRAGLRDTNKPAISFLFTGPTGVGKTEAARQLAVTMGLALHKFDMSEFMEKHSVSKLIGSPPGYIGYGDGGAGNGLLVNAIDENPNCVLLLDEIEKAHPDVFNILLQVMDDGALTNSAGKRVSFRSTILIMTSNAGVSATEKGAFGFGSQIGHSEIDEKVIKRTFTPEFRNRLDAIITFDRLKPDAMTLIVDKFIAELQGMAKPRGVSIDLTTAAREWLAVKGYDPVMGARPLTRVIHEHIKKPLSRLMLLGPLKNGGTAYVTVEAGSLRVTDTAPVPTEAEAPAVS